MVLDWNDVDEVYDRFHLWDGSYGAIVFTEGSVFIEMVRLWDERPEGSPDTPKSVVGTIELCACSEFVLREHKLEHDGHDDWGPSEVWNWTNSAGDSSVVFENEGGRFTTKDRTYAFMQFEAKCGKLRFHLGSSSPPFAIQYKPWITTSDASSLLAVSASAQGFLLFTGRKEGLFLKYQSGWDAVFPSARFSYRIEGQRFTPVETLHFRNAVLSTSQNPCAFVVSDEVIPWIPSLNFYGFDGSVSS